MKSAKTFILVKTVLLSVTFLSLLFLALPLNLFPVSGQRTYILHGSVRTTDGTPISQAKIIAINQTSDTQYDKTTDSNGDYEFSGLLQGKYRVDLIITGYSILIQEIDIGDISEMTASIGHISTELKIIKPNINGNANTAVKRNPVIKMDGERRFNLNFNVDESSKIELTGVITNNGNKAISTARFKIINAATGKAEKAAIDVNGKYEIANLDSGTYRIVIKASGYKKLSKKLMIERDKTKTQNFELRKRTN